MRSFEVAQGRFISQSDLDGARNVVVLGPDLKDKIFPLGQALGRRLRIRDQSFEVIGVLEPKGAVFGSNQDEAAYLPLSTMVSRLSGRDPTYGISLSFISVEAKDDASMGAAAFRSPTCSGNGTASCGKMTSWCVLRKMLSPLCKPSRGIDPLLGAIGAISCLWEGLAS